MSQDRSAERWRNISPQQKRKLSKALSKVLRHSPESIGLTLDANGWAQVSEVLLRLRVGALTLDQSLLDEIVRSDEKQRYRYSEDRTKICANQGHSVKVDLQLTPAIPPQFLYHGTTESALDSIKAHGLQRRQRHHVHLGLDIEMTMKVAARRGRPHLLEIRSLEMHKEGYVFYQTANNVWLIEHVPAEFVNWDK